MFKLVVVPLDGSKHAAKALEHADSLVTSSGGLILMRVIHTVDQLIGARQPDPLDTMDKSEDMLAREAYDEERSEANAISRPLASR
jgi:nucleotide-binding universal stress UspA family protein